MSYRIGQYVGLTAAMLLSSTDALAKSDPLPNWINQIIANQPQDSETNVEEVRYRGHRAFLIMPGDRAPDSGNEHILQAENGHIICEFGGMVGRVSVGSCNIDEIRYLRTLFERTSAHHRH